ncbi:hypothetical protein [Mumia sp. DW29H23]|uniref:hypothetical protein n=1 Tax=Mumia sp. DW29H23 TaxID=3421241 RepID=UPI003D693068
MLRAPAGGTVADLTSAVAFFTGLGPEIEGSTFVEGAFLDTVIGIPDSIGLRAAPVTRGGAGRRP